MPLTTEAGERVWLSRWAGWQARALARHEGKYTYPSPIRSGGKIRVVCPVHGEFLQLPAKHMFGQGCAKCSGLGSDKLAALKAKYPSWDFEGVKLGNTKDKLALTCPVHGQFTTNINRLMNKVEGLSPCPRCAKVSSGAARRDTGQEWEDKVLSRWGNTLHVDVSSITTASEKATFTCQHHGEFRSILQDVVRGHGCPDCGRNRFQEWSDENVKMSFDAFKERADLIKDGVYTYDGDTYVDQVTPMRMVCATHGEFWQIPRNHTTLDAGCPVCSGGRSKAEVEITKFLEGLGESVVTRSRNLDGWEVDILIPRLNLGIEYCGNYWHGEKFKDKGYHAEKLKRARQAGIRLITLFEDEWLYKRNAVESRIKVAVGHGERVGARKCELVSVLWGEAKDFLDENHTQGAGKPAPMCYGLTHQGGLVAVATWGQDRFSITPGLEMYRLCSRTGLIVQGGVSRLVRAAEAHRPGRLVTYADLRWGDGEAYGKAGFTKTGETAPGYSWCKARRRFNRHSFQKHKLSRVLKVYDETKTEVENCHANGYWRIYDCGNAKWEKVVV